MKYTLRVGGVRKNLVVSDAESLGSATRVFFLLRKQLFC
jgi:hypothetical protein